MMCEIFYEEKKIDGRLVEAGQLCSIMFDTVSQVVHYVHENFDSITSIKPEFEPDMGYRSVNPKENWHGTNTYFVFWFRGATTGEQRELFERFTGKPAGMAEVIPLFRT